jgi:hypothetical protein
MTLILQFITAVGKLHSVEGTLPGGVYDTDTTINYAVGKLYSVDGTLPGGVYDTGTTVYYCCR